MLQKYFMKYIELSELPKTISTKSILSNWQPSEIYISLSFLYKFQT